MYLRLYTLRSTLGFDNFFRGGLDGTYFKSVEIYTVEDDTWRPGTDLPHNVGSFAAHLAFKDTFIIAGGHGSDSNTIYKVMILSCIDTF